MESNQKSKDTAMCLVFGYGTFISKRGFINRRNVRPAFLPNYMRVFRPLDKFPYLLDTKDSGVDDIPGFWGLIFEVDDDQLMGLDIYEGEGTLYKRIEVECLEKDGTKVKTFVYYPMPETIQSEKLKDYINTGDQWLVRMKLEVPDILEKYPDLTNPNPPKIK